LIEVELNFHFTLYLLSIKWKKKFPIYLPYFLKDCNQNHTYFFYLAWYTISFWFEAVYMSMSHGFLPSHLQAALDANLTLRAWLQWYRLQIQPSFRPNAIWCVSYQSLNHFWHTDLDRGLYHSPDLDRNGWLTGDAYSSLSPNPWCVHRSVFAPFSDLYFLQDLWDWWLLVIYAIEIAFW
jgi:hypothetical protein